MGEGGPNTAKILKTSFQYGSLGLSTINGEPKNCSRKPARRSTVGGGGGTGEGEEEEHESVIVPRESPRSCLLPLRVAL